MPFARIDDAVLHYAESGRADGPALVFANSLGTDFRIWDAVVARMPAGSRILCYDKRGHGLSDATPAPYAMERHVADLAGLMDRLGLRDAVIAGISVGGMIALGLATARPDLARGLVLCDTAHRIGTYDMWNARIQAIEKDGIAAIAPGILERWFSKAFRATRGEDFAGYRNMLIRTTVAGYTGTCAALRDADLTAGTKRIAVPALCLVGDEDGATPPDLVRSMADLIPGARFEIVAGAGHLPCLEKPDAVAGLIGGFMKENGFV